MKGMEEGRETMWQEGREGIENDVSEREEEKEGGATTCKFTSSFTHY